MSTVKGALCEKHTPCDPAEALEQVKLINNGGIRGVVDSWGTVKFDKEERAGENLLGDGHTASLNRCLGYTGTSIC